MSSILPGGPGAKLTEEEQKLVARVFSDPTYFPVEFRTWLKNYIQDAGITVTTSQVVGSGVGNRTKLPPGLFILCGSLAAVPADALPADGGAHSRVIYDALFGKIGVQWGAGDGSTTFNVPDARDRAFFGAGAAIALGLTDAMAYGTRSGPRHRHSTIDDGHYHHTPDRGETFSLTPGGTQYVLFGDGSNADNRQSDTKATNIRVGPDGTPTDTVNWVSAVIAITTGKAA